MKYWIFDQVRRNMYATFENRTQSTTNITIVCIKVPRNHNSKIFGKPLTGPPLFSLTCVTLLFEALDKVSYS